MSKDVEFVDAYDAERVEAEFAKWSDFVNEAILGPLQQSTCYAGIVTENYLRSSNCALQLGAAVLFGLPICFIVQKGQVLPSKMIKLADLIEYVDFSDEIELHRAHKSIEQFAMNYRG